MRTGAALPRGWAPPGRKPYYNLALEPCIGAPDSLDAAVREWGTAQTLAPGEEREWEVEVALGRWNRAARIARAAEDAGAFGM